MNFFKGDKEAEAPVVDTDADFGDFAQDAVVDAAEPNPIPIAPLDGAAGDATFDSEAAAITARPYTKWYRLDERYTLGDFWIELLILGFFAFMMILYQWGSRSNRARARAWFKSHSPLLAKEFASVGFSNKAVTVDGPTPVDEKQDLRERSPFEFITYATGRTNVAFVDIKLEMIKRFNPVNTLVETGLAAFWESFDMPEDYMEAALYPFDGREGEIVPEVPGSSEVRKADKSAYEGFVFAIVNKDRMKRLRDDRFDLSLTFTKDHPKLPVWVTAMSESAEITEALLTDELVEAVKKAGDLFECLIVTDQPVTKPKTVEECNPSKRIHLKYRLPSSSDTYTDLTPLFALFLRLPDVLARTAHFRPQVTNKLKALREHTIKELKKAADVEKAEERALDRDKARKAKRDRELAGLDAKGQKKYLEKEREREMKKGMKKNTVRG